jgi:4-hydroxybenzoate polyprenyltransferase
MTSVNVPSTRPGESLVVRFLKLIRFSHTLFALPFALTAALLAWSLPPTNGTADSPMVAGSTGPLPGFQWKTLVGILVCMITARSAAMAFNRWTDRTFDAKNPRTRSRHLVTGELSAPQVLLFTLLSAVAFVAATAIFLPNPWPLRLSVPVLAVVLAYSYTKRFTSLSHLWLGFSLLLAPLGTWIAIRGGTMTMDLADLIPPALLGLAVLLWVSGFDIIYACQDAEFDRGHGLKSIPAKCGIAASLRWAALCHSGMIVVLAALPWMAPQLSLGTIYFSGVLGAAALLIYEHLLVQPRDLSRINIAFFHVNAIISIGLLLVTALDVCWS